MNTRILTANMLRNGLVVFLNRDHQWSEAVDEATLARNDDEAEILVETGIKDKLANLIVDPYLVDVLVEDDKIKVAHIRERIRTLGPTVHLDHGKQAEGKGGQFGPVTGAGMTSSSQAKIARGQRT
jgi:Protein of unknown function (DUF2849)